MCCGFDNCYTIATIEENDLEYFQGEILKGNLTKFFKNKTSDGFLLENVLEGSNKSEKEFEFRRGHQKLIISIAKLVKENLDKNGIDGFGFTKRYAETSKAKQNDSVNAKLSDVPFKRQKSSPVQDAMGSWGRDANGEQVLYPEHKEINAGEIAIHRSKLIKQAMASLKNHTPAMLEKVSPFKK